MKISEQLNNFPRTRLWSRRLRDKVDTPPSPIPNVVKNSNDARECGLRDAIQRGWFQQDSSQLLEGFDIPAGETVVDVGCGNGAATAFALRCGAQAIACDVDKNKIESLEAKLKPTHGEALKTLVTDSDPLPLPNEIAARVIAMEVMEHVDNPVRFLSELVRVGKEGSLYLISVPDPIAEGVQKRFVPQTYWQKPNHLHIFEREQLDELIEAAGLKIQRRVHYGFFWAMWWAFFWASDGESDDSEQGPILENWTRTWNALIDSPNGTLIRAALDEILPKSQAIIARKGFTNPGAR